MAMLEAFIHSVAVTDIGFLVLLKNSKDDKMVPIFIGPMEAQSISMVMMKNLPPRPMTHDLLKNIMLKLNFTLEKIQITEIKNNTFFAKIYIKNSDKKSASLVIDSRPSDALALALRFNKPIYINSSVIKEAGILIEEKHKKVEDSPIIKEAIGKQANEKLGDLQKKLEKAVTEERYEDAAGIRDEIKKIIGEHN